MTDLLTRAQLQMRAPRGRSTAIDNEGITLHYGGTPVWGGNGQIGSHDRCPSIWRGWQNYHMDSHGWADIAYSLGACPHGVLLEGRGKGFRTAANGTNAGNQRSHAVCYMAGDHEPLTDAAKIAILDAAALFQLPIKWKHKNWLSTGCPGHDCDVWFDGGLVRPGGSQPLPPPPPQGHSHPTPDVRMWLVNGRRVGQVWHPDGWWTQLPQGPGVWEIRDVQAHLIAKGFSVGSSGADGIGGPSTYNGIVAFQRANGLKPDGWVGNNTWNKLHV